ncbi:kinase-like domain, phloem protein 2-like protein [Tanacetum coccineum]
MNKRQDLERLRIQLGDIKLATDNFNQRYCIGSGGYGMVYKADLDHVDIQKSSSMEWKNIDVLPKKRSTVAIKQIFYRKDDLGKLGFWQEIELLTSCKHPNVVSLLGFSSKDREMILVYEFLVNGSLDDYFGSTEKKINLTWNQRIQICLDIAHGLRYLHTNMEGKPRIIHRDIKSANVLLDENWNAKIADFGLSKFHPANNPASTIRTKIVAGTDVYLDPEYQSTGKYKKESDIYSFGVVLFEILSGRLAYDSVYSTENSKGLAPIARRRFNEGTLKELIDHKMMEEDGEHMFTLNRGPNQDSFNTFSKIAYQCLAETQAKRPTIDVIIEELKNALKLQGETTVLSRFQLSDIVRATKNFAETYCIGLHAYGMVYKADLDQLENKTSPSKGTNNGDQPRKCKSVAIKCISSTENGQEEQRFFAEIKMRTSYKHPNIVSLLGFCDERPHMILVYEHDFNRSLADYLRGNDNNTRLTWVQRLRKCLDIACGLDHLHTKMDSKQRIIHGDINSANIMLSKNLVAKIAYFGISKSHPKIHKSSTPITNDNMGATWLQRLPTFFGISKSHPENQEASTPITNDNIDMKVYWDPVYEKTGKLEIESDMYSFGVVLFEIFCGRLANDPMYYKTDKGLAPMVRRCFNDGTIKNMIDPKLLEETAEDIFTSSDGPNQDSVDTFLKIAYQCLGETQAERPTTKTVIEELEKAINFQENLISKLRISLESIKLATGNFSQENFIRGGRDWKAYKGELAPANNADGRTTIVAKRWNSKSGPGDRQFWTELDILFNRKHENIIGLVGYCNEMDETIIVYKHASNGSLDEHLNNASLTWMKRLRICINIASGLVFLHGGDVTRKKMVHGGIKSASILLTAEWKAQISDLEFSSSDSLHEHKEHTSDNAYGTFGNLDPVYAELGSLTTKSDIYSFGVILFEILCGRLAWSEGREDHSRSLVPLAKCSYKEGKIDEMVFRDIKQQIVPQSLTTFAKIAYECLSDDGFDRPEASEVVIRLKEALTFQEDEEIWDPKLPRNYKEIIDMSENPGIYSNMKKKDVYKMLSEGIFFPKGKVWFSLSKTGKENALVSAKLFSYENSMSRKWRSPGGSRFPIEPRSWDRPINLVKVFPSIENSFLQGL